MGWEQWRELRLTHRLRSIPFLTRRFSPARTGGGLRRGWRLRLLGPLFIYDLARLARRGRTTFLHCVYPALLLAWLCAMAVDRFPALPRQIFHGQSPSMAIPEWAEFARRYVIVILSLQAAAVLVLTPAYLAGAIAEEKERRTLDLLFTSDLRDREVVLGKLVGRLVHLATILLAALPIFALTRLWGGCSDELLLAGFAVSTFTMLSVGGLSLLCSVLFRSVLSAVVISYALVFVLNMCCLAVPVTSPLLFVAEWDRQVDAEWKEWQETLVSAGGLSMGLIPPPDPMKTLLQLLIPFVVLHSLIFLACAITAVKMLRECCLAPGEVMLRGMLLEGQAVMPWASAGGPADAPDVSRNTGGPAAVFPAQPVGEPALLWKEMQQGIAAMPGPGLGDWLVPNWRPVVGTLGTIAAGSFLIWWLAPAPWATTVGALNGLTRAVTVLLAGAWCLLLAFRAAGCVSRERDQRTLDGLLMLPGDRADILRAKWLGSILRYRQLGYGLAAAWAFGLALGALHPAALLLLSAALAVHLAFLSSLGLWLSLVSRNTLWANLSMAAILLLLFLGSLPGPALVPAVDVGREGGWLQRLLEIHISPGLTWWSAAFSWPELARAIAASDRPFLTSLLEALVSLPVFGIAAWVLWRLACRKLRVKS
jgi:ABC-type transport system involved in multi-copper enzyme maturation permease subunit